ncbi:MAG: GAF domain-containing protein, partial [Calditrichaeota bacterium]
TSAILLPSGKDPGSFNLSKTIIKEILNEKNSILINPQEDERCANQESIIMSEIKSAMAVPLFDEGQVLGIFYVDTTNPLHMYNDDYLRLLATFGNLIASRLLNYELLNERQAKQVMEAELERASSIQNNLLIKTSPEYSGYQIRTFQEQCKMVGGDLFDITMLDDGKLLFLVADVSGKGMGGALLMSNILAAFRILYKNESKFDLVKVTKQISKQLHAYSRPEDFATLFIGTIDNKTNELTFLNAGHNPPLLARANGDIEYLEPSGIMIGAFDFSDWQEEKVTMQPNDTLIVFTDGVVEAERHGELYGDERLESLVKRCISLNAQKIVDTIVTDVLDYVADSPRSDDITMIALKRE